MPKKNYDYSGVEPNTAAILKDIEKRLEAGKL